MEFRLLGPFEVADGGGVVRLGEGRQRSVLVLLLLHRNEPVSSDRLIDALWGERPPPTAAKVLQNHVAQLRRAFGDRDAGRLQTRGRGYLLRVEPGELDVDRFDELVRGGGKALAGDEPAEASARLGEALALWRGPALVDVAYESFAQGEIARLEERRLMAVEQHADAELALGRYAELIPELEALVTEHPLRERLRGQLMLALYRAGRQGEALESYRDARRALVDELGVEPGPALRELEAAILRQDATLAPAPARWPRLRDRSSRVRALLVIGAAALMAAAAAAVLVEGGQRARRGLLAGDTVGAIDAASGRLVAAVHVPGLPDRLAVTKRAIWAIADDSGTLARIDIARRSVTSVVPAGGAPRDLVAGFGSLWTIDERRRQLLEISPDYHSVVGRIRLPRPPGPTELRVGRSFDDWALAAGAGALWVTNGSLQLIRVEPRGRRVTRIDVRHPLDGVTVARGAVWAISGQAASVLRIDPRRRTAARPIPIVARRGFESPYPIAIEAGLGSIWVLNGNTATVTRIDPRQRGIAHTIPIGIEHAPVRLAVGAGAVWAAGADGTLTRLDPATNTLTTTAIARGLNDVAVAGDAVWVSAVPGPGPTQSPPAATARPSVRALPTSACSPLYYRPGDRPRLLIASDFPLQAPTTAQGAQITEAIRFVLRRHGFQAGRYPIAYQSCDESIPEGGPDLGKCASNARAYARDTSVVAVIGPWSSACTRVEVPILNRAQRGPLAAISPASTYVGLTRAGPGTGPGEPARYAPTGRRSFVRLIAPDDVQAAADAQLARQLGVGRVFILNDDFPYSAGIAADFRRAARRLGIRVAGSSNWAARHGLAERVRASGADGVFLGGYLLPYGAPAITTLRHGLPAATRLIAPDGFFTPDVVRYAGRAAEGLTVSLPGLPLERLPGPGAEFVARFSAAIGQRPDTYVANAAQATDVLLDAINRSDGTRASVVRELFATRVNNGILGTFAITPQGDTTARAVTMYRIQHGALHTWRVITPPANLTGG